MTSRLHQTTVVNIVEYTLALRYAANKTRKHWSPETHPHVYGQVSRSQRQYCRAMLVFSSKWLEEFNILVNKKLNFVAGTDVEAMEHCCLLACSSRFLSLFSYSLLEPLASEWPHPQWAASSHISHEDKALQPNLPEAFSQLGFPPLRSY